MPNLNVCTGKAFGVGASGELVVAGSNSNAWSLSAPIASANGLNTDPTNGGLWTAPHGCYSLYQEQIQSSLSQPITTTLFTFPTTNFTFTNPSAASKMRICAFILARQTVNLSPASDAFVRLVSFFGGGVGTRTAVSHVSNPTSATVNGAQSTTNNSAEHFVNAGATASLTVTASSTAMAGSGAITLTEWVVWVHFVAWLLDPTQAGGIS